MEEDLRAGYEPPLLSGGMTGECGEMGRTAEPVPLEIRGWSVGKQARSMGQASQGGSHVPAAFSLKCPPTWQAIYVAGSQQGRVFSPCSKLIPENTGGNRGRDSRCYKHFLILKKFY